MRGAGQVAGHALPPAAAHAGRDRRAASPRPAPRNQLTTAERAAVLATLNHESFVDKSPAQVWATLLDEGTYLCSESTMYRILRSAGGVRERRLSPKQRAALVAHTAPRYSRPAHR